VRITEKRRAVTISKWAIMHRCSARQSKGKIFGIYLIDIKNAFGKYRMYTIHLLHNRPLDLVKSIENKLPSVRRNNARNNKMRISIQKTKTLAIAMDPTRWKLAMDNKIIEQVSKVEYLRIKISNDGKVKE
jgi:hypothetical protein